MKKILGRMRRAIKDYNMINDGDKIIIGLSGGKDSQTLLVTMAMLRKYLPIKFDLMAVTLDMGIEGFDPNPLYKLCEKYDVPFILKPTNIAEVVFDIKKAKSPCSLCANMRRGALHTIVVEQGFNKVALGHHLDDTIETFLMSLLYEGRINTFLPVTYLSRTGIHVIRPMVYVTENEIKGFVKHNNLSVVHNPCPVNCHTNREFMKNLIKDLCKRDPIIKTRIFGAIQRGLPAWKLNSNNNQEES